jgi:hypothetical protein
MKPRLEVDMNARRAETLGIVLMGVLLGAPAAALAQAAPTVEVAGGYHLIAMTHAGSSKAAPKGWFADVSARVNEVIAIVGTAGGGYTSFPTEFDTRIDEDHVVHVSATFGGTLRTHAVMGGVRFTPRGASRLAPFGQVLCGVGLLSGSVMPSSIAKSGFDVGGGVTAWLRPTIGLRVGGDYVRVFSKGETARDTVEDLHVLRVTVGAVVPLGGRRPPTAP